MRHVISTLLLASTTVAPIAAKIKVLADLVAAAEELFRRVAAVMAFVVDTNFMPDLRAVQSMLNQDQTTRASHPLIQEDLNPVILGIVAALLHVKGVSTLWAQLKTGGRRGDG